ncbi:MAG: hypothetical protein R3B13_26120 [Polyangiaceae bacterium]
MRRWWLAALALVVAAGVLWVSTREDKAKLAASSAKASSSDQARAVETPAEPAPAIVASASAAPARAKASAPTFFAGWGSGPDDLGRERPVEGNPVGPMSFALDGKGTMTVLDGVNGRLVRRQEGQPTQVQAIDLVNPEDVAVGEDGSAAVLDRFRDKTVAIYDASGKQIGKLPLEGEGVSDTGSVTGVFVDGKDVYVERGHGPLVKLGDTSGATAQPRSEIPGRPTRDGLSYLKAGIIDAAAGRVYVVSVERATETHRFTRELRLGSHVNLIVLLDADRKGTIYFAAEVRGVEDAAEVVLYCLDGLTGVPTGSALLPANTLPEESFRDYVVLDEGGVMQALRSESGVSYTRYDCM